MSGRSRNPSGGVRPSSLGLAFVDGLPAEGCSARRLPPLEAKRKPVRIRAIDRASGQDDPGPVQLLKAMPEHGTVALLENLSADMHRVVRAYPQDVAVIGGMVNLAEGETVLHDRGASIIGVGNDVGGIQELGVPQPTDRASAVVRGDDDVPKGALVKALPGLGPRAAAQIQGGKGDSCRIRLGPQVSIGRVFQAVFITGESRGKELSRALPCGRGAYILCINMGLSE